MSALSLPIILGKIVLVIAVLLGAIAYMTYLERRLVAFFQWRLGPNRVGPLGLLQPIADGVKLLFKQELIPEGADRFVYILAPMVSFVTATAVIAVVPITKDFFISDVNVGVLLFLALSSLGTYGIILAGWSSGNKYSFLGALRSCSQMISYELALGLSVIGVIIMAQSFSLKEIVLRQETLWFMVPQFLGFLAFIIAGIAETNRAPFDLPEAESELVAGYHTEYSSMKFAMFFLGEYSAIINISLLTTVLFLGGWNGPAIFGSLTALNNLFWFFLKTFAVIFFFIWLRATLPRFRYDQLMKFGWLVLFPLALANIVITSGFMALS